MSNTTNTSSGQLERNSIGLTQAAFQPITTMGPAASVVASLLVAASFAGGAMPLAILAAAVACVFVANSIGQLAKHMPSSASFATYSSQALHPAVGAWVGWLYTSASALLPPLFPLIIGSFLAGALQGSWGWSTDTWVIWAVMGVAVTFVMSYRGLKTSARLSLYLGLFELAVLLVLFIWLTISHSSHATLNVFTLKFANIPGFHGMSGIVAGSVFAFLAFTGFEAAAPLAEETKDPKRVVPRAVVLAAVVVGVLYIFSGYAATVAFGPTHMGVFATTNGGNPWHLLASQAWGAGWVILLLAVINSCLAGGNAATNAASRTWFGMGRIGLLPHGVAAVHHRYGTPYRALIAQGLINLVLVVVLGEIWGPVTAFGFLATIYVLLLLTVYAMMNISCIVYYLRVRRQDFNIVLHLVMPVIGIAMLIPAIFAGAGVKVFSFISALPSPLSYASIIYAVAMVGGAGYVAYLYQKGHSSRIAATGIVFLDEVPIEEAVPGGDVPVGQAGLAGA